MKKLLANIIDLSIGPADSPLYTGINFEIREGDCILLCGANGSGKTTLLKALSRLIEQTKCAMIPTGIPKVKGFTLTEFIGLFCHNHPKAKTKEAMAILSLEQLADRDISTLSDGEFQKGTIAAAIARQAEIILLDEPTAFLDAENRRNVLEALKTICETTSTAIIFSSHDLHESCKVANKVLALGADGMFHQSFEDLDITIRTIFSNK